MQGQPVLPSHSRCHPYSRTQGLNQLEDRGTAASPLRVRRQVLESEMQSVCDAGSDLASLWTVRAQTDGSIAIGSATPSSPAGASTSLPRALRSPAYVLTKTPRWFPTSVTPWYLPFGIQMCSETVKAGKAEGDSGSPPSSQGQGYRDADVSRFHGPEELGCARMRSLSQPPFTIPTKAPLPSLDNQGWGFSNDCHLGLLKGLLLCVGLGRGSRL